MISNEKKETNIEVEKNEIIAYFTNLVQSSCNDHDAIQSVWKYIKPIESTLQAARRLRSGNDLVSSSKNKNKRLLTPQKRFKKTKNRQSTVIERVQSELDKEIFMSQRYSLNDSNEVL